MAVTVDVPVGYPVRVVRPVWTSLNAWNLADDVARSLGLPGVDRDRLAQRCYNKLVVANVPWLADRETYVPRWTKHEVRCLRRVLGQAVALLGRALGP